MPEEPITWVTDLTPVKASLQAKAFNQAGEFNTDMLANIQQTVKTQQVTEPLSYQEWVKDYQTQKGEADAEAAYQQYLDNFEYSKPSTIQRKTYSGMIQNLAPNQVFVFGSNTQGKHGKGAALTAKNKFGAIYGQAEGPQGQSYAIITKDLTKNTHPSRTPEQIKEQVHNLYEYARENPDKEFLVAYSGKGTNLNAYSNQEMADMFGSEPIPNNIVFEQEFNKLIPIASERPSETINIYAGTGENADLSNFAVRPFTISGDKSESSIRIGGNFQTVEGAFQAQKLVFSSMSDDEKEVIRKQLETASGSQARSIGRKIKDLNTVSWDKASSDVMRDLLLESFSQNPEALNRLLSTGDVTLTHTQDKGKWGTEFPRILMEVRELLRNRSNIEPAITGTTKEFLDYANQFGFTDEAASLAKDLPKAVEEAKKVEEEYVFTFNDGFKINLPFSLNDQQKSALYELEKFIEDGGTEITLSGYAGTGKSTIIGIFSKWLNNRIGRGNIVYTAPTHRANVITKQNNPNANVYTLSALFGFTPDTDIAMEQGSLDLRELEFRSKNQVKYEPGQLIIIDEASMVQDGLYEYIQKIVAKDGVSVIYVGDSAQLRPVKSDHISKVFTSDGVPQITLTKVERTGDNPILKEATRLRRGEGLSYQTDINDKGQGVLYTSDDAIIDKNLKQIVTSEEFNADPLHFRVLTATNAAVSAYNSKIRSLRYGKFAKPFVKGDIIMGYSNKLRKPDGSYKLVNSGDYVIQNITDTTVKFKTDKGDIEFKAFKLSIRPTGSTIMDDFQITVIDKNEPDSKLFEIVEYKDRLWRMAKEAKQNKQISKYRDLVQMAFNIDNELNITKNLEDNQGRLKIRKAIDYGYAQTVWKSQGSTYSKVLILSNEIDTFGYGRDVMQLRNELRYVAVSRAKNFVIINSEAENKKKVSMRNEIAEEDLLDDIEFEPATEEQAIKASLQDSIDELTANGKQRRKECE